MRIVDGEVGRYEVRMARTYVSATAQHDFRSGVIVRLDAEQGPQGLGEAAPFSNRTESLHASTRVLVGGLKTFVEKEPDAERALEALDQLVPGTSQARAARFGLSLALCDLLAGAEDRPLAPWLAQRALDGRDTETEVPVNATIPDGSVEDAREQAERAVTRGFSTIKLKGGREPERDIERVAAVREAVGSDVALRIDVNGAWPDTAAALEHLDALEPYQLEYVEQPLPPKQLDEMSALRGATSVPIWADEPVLTPTMARTVIEREAADGLVLKPMVLGGPLRALHAAQLAEDAGLPVVVTSTIDGAIARAGALHTAAALGPLEHACGLATGELLEDEPASFDEHITEGHLHVPEVPGHGAWLTKPLHRMIRRWTTP